MKKISIIEYTEQLSIEERSTSLSLYQLSETPTYDIRESDVYLPNLIYLDFINDLFIG